MWLAIVELDYNLFRYLTQSSNLYEALALNACRVDFLRSESVEALIRLGCG